MKKIIATLVAFAAAMTMSVFAEGYLSANDLTPGEITDVKTEEDGFVINASAERSMKVDAPEKPVVVGEDQFTQRLSLKGKMVGGLRTVTFPVKKGEKIEVIAHSGSKTDARKLAVADPDGNIVKEINCGPYVGDAAKESVVAAADGEYSVYGLASCYIYQIKVTK